MLHQIGHARKMPAKRPTQIIMAASIFALSIGIAPPIFSQAAHASRYEEVRTKIVHYGDLNLASVEGQQVLGQRIRRAAKQVCDVVGIASTLERRKMRKCADAAHSNAWAIAQQHIGKYRLAVRAQN
jgi:UrcA family protein